MFSLWRKARRENSAASRLLGSTSLRFALHGWQRSIIAWAMVAAARADRLAIRPLGNLDFQLGCRFVTNPAHRLVDK
ncbi:hypothetical protein [Thiolapillus sp.]|uniref:hypothetical protein n=1 Tax=Thiolapillus sp. TaxID=2017437 RepID=UPI003AF9D2E6